MKDIIYLFHHIHHRGGGHEVHHCGGKHIEVDSKLDYAIRHCACGLHAIDKEEAIGHTIGASLESIEVLVKFTEKCPEGGWHVESGVAKS